MRSAYLPGMFVLLRLVSFPVGLLSSSICSASFQALWCTLLRSAYYRIVTWVHSLSDMVCAVSYSRLSICHPCFDRIVCRASSRMFRPNLLSLALIGRLIRCYFGRFDPSCLIHRLTAIRQTRGSFRRAGPVIRLLFACPRSLFEFGGWIFSCLKYLHPGPSFPCSSLPGPSLLSLPPSSSRMPPKKGANSSRTTKTSPERPVSVKPLRSSRPRLFIPYGFRSRCTFVYWFP